MSSSGLPSASSDSDSDSDSKPTTHPTPTTEDSEYWSSIVDRRDINHVVLASDGRVHNATWCLLHGNATDPQCRNEYGFYGGAAHDSEEGEVLD